MREESSFRPKVMSSAGARGLLQLMPETAERMTRMYSLGAFDEEALFVPETNIAAGSAYLDHLAGRFPGRLSAAVGSYNAGPLAVKRWLKGPSGELEDDVWVEDIPYGQTRSYVKRVLRSYYVYKTLY
jgi:soluble lytic murein transglycosylase